MKHSGYGLSWRSLTDWLGLLVVNPFFREAHVAQSKLTILNGGPGLLKAEVLHRDDDGRFLPGEETLVSPGAFADLVVDEGATVHLWPQEMPDASAES